MGFEILTDINAYDIQMLNELALEKISEQDINNELIQYLKNYNDCFTEPAQTKYFEAFERGILSGLDRKSIEPIALHFLDQKQVRGMQQFFKRSKNWETNLTKQYQTQLAKQIAHQEGFASIDESCFVKKGAKSAGVARQYCGRLGKKENCQSGVFLSYASQKGYGLIEEKLYLPKHWFEDSFKEKRDSCQIPKDTEFQTKNQIAAQMLNKLISEEQFPVKWVGCDAAFGCDHDFLDSLPNTVCYFASVRETEYIFTSTPTMVMPKNSSGLGRKIKHARVLDVRPVCIKTLVDDEVVVWQRRVITLGSKGSVVADIKCVRVVSCRRINNFFVAGVPIWVYIRRYDDGVVKYFVSNAPLDVEQCVLDRLATLRWSIEQCFQECKSYLGMSHYETRSFQAWHRHMLLVMVAHLFTIVLRGVFKKTMFF